MTNPNPNKHGTRITDLSFMFGRYSPVSQYGEPDQHSANVDIIISGTQTINKATTERKNINGKMD